MNVEELRSYCLSLKGVEEGFPFRVETLVCKVMGKMFCLTGLDRTPFQCNLKCNPAKAIELREDFSGVKPGWHMNKAHWNTVEFDGSFSDEQAKKWISDSYNFVANSLAKKLKIELEQL